MRGPAGPSARTVLAQCRAIARQLDWHLARARAGAPRGGRTEVEAALRPILSAMGRLHGAKGLVFELEGGPLSAVAIDPDDFAEIVSNLLDNAGKWARSIVRVGWMAEADRVSIRIADDGPGIPADARARLFTPGARLDEQVSGHGLGLAIAKDLAGRVGGVIALDDLPGGQPGLQVRVILPAARASGDARPTGATTA